MFPTCTFDITTFFLIFSFQNTKNEFLSKKILIDFSYVLWYFLSIKIINYFILNIKITLFKNFKI